jgi:hypothetical protein
MPITNRKANRPSRRGVSTENRLGEFFIKPIVCYEIRLLE